MRKEELRKEEIVEQESFQVNDADAQQSTNIKWGVSSQISQYLTNSPLSRGVNKESPAPEKGDSDK